MRLRKSPVRAVVSVLLALVFFVAVLPGAMAMPTPQNAMSHSAMSPNAMSNDCMASAASHCDHMKPVKAPASPCKNMQVCAGMLGCFGLAAVVHDAVTPFVAVADERVPDRHQTLVGLTAPPDDRPPIV
jgi:hypothetical protein